MLLLLCRSPSSPVRWGGGREKRAGVMRAQRRRRVRRRPPEQPRQQRTENPGDLPQVLPRHPEPHRRRQQQRPARREARAHPVGSDLEIDLAGPRERLGLGRVFDRVRPGVKARALQLGVASPAHSQGERDDDHAQHQEDQGATRGHRELSFSSGWGRRGSGPAGRRSARLRRCAGPGRRGRGARPRCSGSWAPRGLRAGSPPPRSPAGRPTGW
jgi:hypothetical protein